MGSITECMPSVSRSVRQAHKVKTRRELIETINLVKIFPLACFTDDPIFGQTSHNSRSHGPTEFQNQKRTITGKKSATEVFTVGLQQRGRGIFTTQLCSTAKPMLGLSKVRNRNCL